MDKATELSLRSIPTTRRIVDAATAWNWFERVEGVWVYKGPPAASRPHAQLSSGLCSDGYFDCPRLLSFPNIAEILAVALAYKLRTLDSGLNVDWVVSSAYSAITYGHEVAKALGARFANVEKDPSDPAQKKMLWRRMSIPPGETVLQVEELVTTWGTTQQVREAVEYGNDTNVQFLPVVATLVLRPTDLQAMHTEHNVVALLEKEVHTWKPPECPYCAVGSKALKPKAHWAELTGAR